MDGANTGLHSAEVYQALADQAVDSITLIDANGIVLYQNFASLEYFGWEPGELIGHPIFDFIHPEDLDLTLKAYESLHQNEDIDRIIVRLLHKTEDWRLVEIVGSVYQLKGEPVMILNTRDVTTRESTVKQLAQSEALFRAAFNATKTIYLIFDLESQQIVNVNQAWVEFSGYSFAESVNKTAIELGVLLSVEERDAIFEKLRLEGSLNQYRITAVNYKGETRSLLLDARIVETDATPLIHFSAIDMTDHEKMEHQLRQSQKMEAVGQLTGGIAHDFNNILTVILGHVDLNMNRYLSQDQVRGTLGTIRSAAEIGIGLVQKLMTFSRKQVLHTEVFKVSDSLTSIVALLEPMLGKQIRIDYQPESDWSVLLDRGLFENAIVNIAINARDAMPDGGLLTIGVKELGIADGDLEAIEINISDTGKGMSEPVLQQIFEPFYTTKHEGEGTGLGLAMV